MVEVSTCVIHCHTLLSIEGVRSFLELSVSHNRLYEYFFEIWHVYFLQLHH